MKCPKCHFDNPSDSKFCKECGTQIIPLEEIPASPTKTLETPTEELNTGSTFAGRYLIIEELGKGGMGKVYRVLDKELKEEVALKLIRPEIASDKKTLERFSNELKLARKISHKNVGRMYELMEEKGTRYITMEYVPGEDLKRLIRKVGQFSAGKTVSIAKQVCEGLTEAHRLGVVHRDLKPQNVMVDEEGNARILDFGIARSLKAKGITGAGVMVGTPEYMSPEQAEVKEVDQRSDIYSLGVILYEMVTGRVPFEGETPLGIAMRHKSEKPKDPREINAQIPEDLSHVILRCMEKDKENRYQSAGEVRAELSSIEKGIPTTDIEIPKRKPITSREITVTFGLKKLFIPALVVIAIVIAAVIIWQLLPRKEVVLAPKIENSIAVISFKNQTGDKSYDYLQEAIPNLLITNLENTAYLYVATWERMHDLLKQIGKKDVEIVDRDLGFELCRMEGIEAIVLGSFIKAGDMFATDVKVLDVESKKLLKSASTKGKGADSILETQIDDLSREISQGIGIARQKIETAQLKVSDVTTTSIDAYNYFLRGRDNFEKFYYDDARQFLEKAVELDPNFATAYHYLAMTNISLGDTKTANEAYEKAKTYSGKATEKERLYIETSYAWFVEGNQEKCFHMLQQIANKYPKEKMVHYWLGSYYMFRKSFNQAIEEYNKALELDPNYGEVINQLGYTYSDMGDYEKAIEYLKRYASISPGDANPLDSMAEIYLRMGRLDEAIAKYKEVLEVKPDFFLTCLTIGYIYALKQDYIESMKWVDQYIAMASSPGLRAAGFCWKGLLHYWLGRLEQSISDLRRAKDLAEAIESRAWEALAEWMKGWVYYDRGEYEMSRRCFKNCLSSIIELEKLYIPYYTADYNFYLGLVDLKQGRLDSAKSKLDEMKSLLAEIDPYRKAQIAFRYNLLKGEVLFAEGSIEKAIAVCEKESPLGEPPYIQDILPYNIPFLKDVLARAYLQNGELDKAITEYERLITFDPSREERCLIHPKYHYRLAKIHEQKGQKGKAIEHYEKFLDLWKDADPDIPEVEDAKKRLAGLKGQ